MPHIQTGETRLYFERQGAGPPLLFVAGLGGRGVYWRAQIDDFCRDYTVIVFDHRGVGRSGPARPPFSISGLAQDVIGLMDALDLPKTVYVGHSAGGAMGQWLAANHPERFTAMFLGATWRRTDARFRALFEARRETLLKLGPLGYIRHSLPWLYPRDWFADNAEHLHAVVRRMAAELPPEQVLAGRLDAILGSDHLVDLGTVAMPVMVAYASDDNLIPPAYALEVAHAIPEAQKRRFASGGHHFPQTRARRFNAALRAFIEDAAAEKRSPRMARAAGRQT